MVSKRDGSSFLLRPVFEGSDYFWSSVAELSDKVVAVMDDQAARGQILKKGEPAARKRFPDLVVASQGAIRNSKPDSALAAR